MKGIFRCISITCLITVTVSIIIGISYKYLIFNSLLFNITTNIKYKIMYINNIILTAMFEKLQKINM